MVGALLVSSLFVDAVDRGLILSMQYLFAYFLLPLIILARPWDETETLMKVFVASMVMTILHEIYVVDYVGETNTTFVSGAGRMLGFVERDNECGSLYALTVPMVLSMAAMRTIRPIVAVIVLALLGYGIMLTGSNTALYAMLFGLGMFAFASLTAARIFQAVICVLVLWAAISVPAVRELLPAVFQKRVLVGLETGEPQRGRHVCGPGRADQGSVPSWRKRLFCLAMALINIGNSVQLACACAQSLSADLERRRALRLGWFPDDAVWRRHHGGGRLALGGQRRSSLRLFDRNAVCHSGKRGAACLWPLLGCPGAPVACSGHHAVNSWATTSARCATADPVALASGAVTRLGRQMS